MLNTIRRGERSGNTFLVSTEKIPGSTDIQLYVGVTLCMPDTAGGGGYRGIQEETPDPEAVVKICRLLED
jgi:hypothetical protein